MTHAIGIEGLRMLPWLLAIAAVGAVVMGVATVMGDEPDDVARGEAPSLPIVPLMGWSVAAILSGAAAVMLWAMLPDKTEAADEGFDWLE